MEPTLLLLLLLLRRRDKLLRLLFVLSLRCSVVVVVEVAVVQVAVVEVAVDVMITIAIFHLISHLFPLPCSPCSLPSPPFLCPLPITQPFPLHRQL